MKKFIIITITLLFSIASFAQKNVTMFLGIPVDGTKSEMIQKLKQKGFTYNYSLDCLEGEFNGNDVQISIVTNNNKVWRIVVCDAYPTNSESQIRIRFNTLCRQFANNDKYIKSNIFAEYEIDEKEDISYELTVHDKHYQASYYQISSVDDITNIDTAEIIEYLQNKYTEEERKKLTDEDILSEFFDIVNDYFFLKISHKSVWFTIFESFNGRGYEIVLYYDNRLNKANGEDL
ncbi:MAG: hypothetical protein J6Y47_08285 [Bacteroidales bacterium]|nr:hypothetical protein [Bacteroidales bacterium]